jgi:hypothetical protein
MDSLSPRLHLAITSAAVQDVQQGEQDVAELDAATDSPAAELDSPAGGVDAVAGTRFGWRSSTR